MKLQLLRDMVGDLECHLREDEAMFDALLGAVHPDHRTSARNNSPYVAEAAAALDDILRRMEQHQYKKRSLDRRLHLELARRSH